VKHDDPLGKRALFSAPEAPKPHPGPFDIDVHCSSCDATTRLSAVQVAVRHLPVSAWLPIPGRRHAHLMRCPACRKLTWVSLGFAR
jgi:hypothetical protein